MAPIEKMKGYKIFNGDWTCRGFQYRVGETAEFSEPLQACKTGLHFCTRALDCLHYYNLNSTNRYAEVEAVGEVIEQGDKCVTNRLLVTRELSQEEFAALCSGTMYKSYTDGKKESNYLNGQLHGLETVWQLDGTLRFTCEYNNGQRHGTYAVWSGSTKIHECTYDSGQKHGFLMNWDWNGKKISEYHHERDQPHGVCTEWWSTGMKRSECHYEHGQKHGKYTEWYENGMKSFECTYNFGQEIDLLFYKY